MNPAIKSSIRPLNSPTSLQPALKRRRSDSSSSTPSESQTSATRWFHHVNRNLKPDVEGCSDFEHEPPFYLNHPLTRPIPTQTAPDLSFDPARLPSRDIDSENGDLRSVIDDLTIENKRLKQELFEARHNTQRDPDKLLELRTYSLSSAKKRELAALLQKFTTTTLRGTGSAQSLTTKPDWGRDGGSAVAGDGISQLSTFDPHPDSAYASLSNSGMTSTRGTNDGRRDGRSIRGARNKTVKSYRPDMASALLPKQSPTMSQESKMNLVVERLEQIFTGRKAAYADSNHPIRHRILSESASRPDRPTSQILGKRSRPEGAREASILPFGSTLDLEPLQPGTSSKEDLVEQPRSDESGTRSSIDNRSLDQRPTRPKDLDIHRALGRDENLEYIRHLGFLPPELGGDSNRIDSSWVYLNLLINMAQLHTANVTPAFVKKSIAQVSTKFELSEDGQKIRWKGGLTNRALSIDHRRDMETGIGLSPSPGQDLKHADDSTSRELSIPPPLPSPLAPRESGFDDSSTPDPAASYISHPPSTFRPRTGSFVEYKPILTTPQQPPPRHPDTKYEDTVRLLKWHTLHDLARRDSDSLLEDFAERQDEEGPISYYRNSMFFCDLSSDKDAHLMEQRPTLPHGGPILGVVGSGNDLHSECDHHSFSLGNHVLDESLSVDDLPSLRLEAMSDVIEYSTRPMDLVASGIGGVLPADHFVLQVQRRHYPPTADRASCPAQRRAGHPPLATEEIVLTTRSDIPASELPPPSYVCISLTSQSSFQTESDESCLASSDDIENPAYDVQASTLSRDGRLLENASEHWSNSRQDRDVSATSSTTSEMPQGDSEDGGHDEETSSDGDLLSELEGPLELTTGSMAVTIGTGTVASIAGSRSIISGLT